MNKGQLYKVLGVVVFLLLLCLIPLFVQSVYWIHVLIVIIINILLVAGLRAVFLTGEVSLGTAGFMLLGAYGSALLALKTGLSFWIAMPLGGLFAAAVALLLGYPFFRVKGIYFSILTLLLAVVFQYVAGYWFSFTGGWDGLRNIPVPDPITFPGLFTISFEGDVAYYYLCLIVVGVSLFIFYRMEHSRIGLVWKAIKETDTLAQSVGINIMWYKIFIFSVGCFFAGIAGALFAHYVHILSPATNPGNQFNSFTSVYALLYMVVGGSASFAGPIIGTTVLLLIPEIARPLQEYRPLVNGAILILVVFFMPGGLISLGKYFPIWYRALLGRFRKDKTSVVHG